MQKSQFSKICILTKQSVFSVHNRLVKQTDGCQMEGPIFVVFQIFMFARWREYRGNFKTSFLQTLCEWCVCKNENEWNWSNLQVTELIQSKYKTNLRFEFNQVSRYRVYS